MHMFITLTAALLLLFGRVSTKDCEDCMNFDKCPEALELALYKQNENLFIEAACGVDQSNPSKPIPKVCCSDFLTPIVMTDEDNRIDNHSSQKLLPNDCGVIQGDRIVGGTLADLYEFPWMALISHMTADGPSFKCGGSIINSRYILTAAHCLHNRKIAGVRVGEYDISSQYDCQNNVCENHIQDIRVANAIVHEDYRGLPRVVNDIALLRLATDIDFNHRNVDAICLPRTARLRQRSLAKKLGTVTGWGLTENGTNSAILREVTIPIHTAAECRSFYARFDKPGQDSTASQLCAGTTNQDSCNGDSGGPLMFEEKYNEIFRYVQYGVVSHGPAKCGSDFPGVYTDVSKYMGWILDHITA